MSHASQFALIVATLVASWLGMQQVHELGHVAAAGLTGGRVTRVVLHPLTFSRTDVAPNPRPRVVAWAGPVVGVGLPLVAWLAATAGRLAGAFVLRFFAGFCCVANGLYLGVGSFGRVGDCGDLLRHGAALWQLWVFGLVTVPLGFWLWSGLGPQFGFGPTAQQPSRGIVLAVSLVATALVILGLIVDGR